MAPLCICRDCVHELESLRHDLFLDLAGYLEQWLPERWSDELWIVQPPSSDRIPSWTVVFRELLLPLDDRRR